MVVTKSNAHGVLTDEKTNFYNRYSFTSQVTDIKPLSDKAKHWLNDNGKHYSQSTLDHFGIKEGRIYGEPCLVFPLKGGYKCYRYQRADKSKRWSFTKGTKAQLMGDINSQNLIICEGEWDMLRLHEKGFAAVTGTNGAGVWKKEWNESFRGKEIAIIYDVNDPDERGEKGALKVAQNLSGVAKTVRLIRLPLSKESGDITDFFGLGHTRKDLEKLIADTPPFKSSGYDQSIVEGKDGYYSRGDPPKRLSSFLIEPTQRLRMDDGEVLKADIVCGHERHEDIRIPKEAWNSKGRFLSALPSMDMQWLGSDQQVQQLMLHIAAQDIPTVRGTEIVGLDGKKWVIPQGVITSDGWEDEPDIILDSNEESLHPKIHYDTLSKEELDAVLRAIYEYLPQINDPRIVLPVIGWFFAAPFKPRIMKSLGHFPILNLWGTRGGGKTATITQIFWPLFGVDREPYAITQTAFATIKVLASNNAIPVFFDEYKPHDLPNEDLKRFHRLTREVYDGEVETRGRQDLTTKAFTLTAPLAFAGEVMPTESAILDRIISVELGPDSVGTDSQAFRSFEQLRTPRLAGFTPHYIQFTLRFDFDTRLEQARELTKKLTPSWLRHRIRDNLTTVVLGLLAFEEFGSLHNLSSSVCLEAHLKDVLEGLVTNLVDDREDSKLAVDDFLELLSVMAGMDIIQFNSHYTVNSDGHLCIHMPSCYPEFKKYAKATDHDGEILNRKAYIRQFAQRTYFVEEGKNVRFGDKVKRAVVIDPQDSRLDLSGFKGVENELS